MTLHTDSTAADAPSGRIGAVRNTRQDEAPQQGQEEDVHKGTNWNNIDSSPGIPRSGHSGEEPPSAILPCLR